MSLTNIIIYVLGLDLIKNKLLFKMILGQPIKYINFKQFSKNMKSESNSPNIFQNIYLSTSKHLQPQTTICSQQQPFLFKNKLQTIAEFLEVLQNQEVNSHEIQLQWQKSFFKNELKAALFLNYSLVKLQSQSIAEISKLKETINSYSSPHSQLKKCQNRVQFELSPQKKLEDRQNSGTPSKNRSIKQAFEAQKKILNVRHSKEKQQLNKSLQHAECMLRASKEQNEYLRSQLIKLTQKLKSLQKSKKQLEQGKIASHNEIVRLNKVIQDLNQKQKKWNQQKRFAQLNCSPIHNQNVFDSDKQCQISFNHEFFTQNLTIENKLLKKQLQQAQFQLDYQKQEKFKIQQMPANQQKKEHNQVMIQSRRLFLVALENEYLEIKQELELRVKQIEKYKQIVSEAKRISETSLIQLKNENKSLKQALQQLKIKFDKDCHESIEFIEQIQASRNDNCQNCTFWQGKYTNLLKQSNSIQEKNQKLKQKIDKTLKIQILQRKQWDLFLKDFQKDV